MEMEIKIKDEQIIQVIKDGGGDDLIFSLIDNPVFKEFITDALCFYLSEKDLSLHVSSLNNSLWEHKVGIEDLLYLIFKIDERDMDKDTLESIKNYQQQLLNLVKRLEELKKDIEKILD